jgi:hypothetical protein
MQAMCKLCCVDAGEKHLRDFFDSKGENGPANWYAQYRPDDDVSEVGTGTPSAALPRRLPSHAPRLASYAARSHS